MAISAADMLADVVAIANGIPDALRKSVTLSNRTGGDNYGAGVVYVAYKLPLQYTETTGLHRVTVRWNLLGTLGQTVLPTRGSKIAYESSTYHVVSVERAFGDLFHRCDCYEEV